MKISTRIFSVIIAAVMLITAIPLSASAKTGSDYQAEIDKWDKLIEENDKNKANKEAQFEAIESQNEALDKQIAAIDAEILPIQKKIDELTESIEELEKKINKLQGEIVEVEEKTEEQNKAIDETYELLKDRMRADYMAGETSELELFLNSGSFEEFMVRSELLRQVAERDNQIVDDLEAQIEELNILLEELTAKKTETEESKLKIEADRKEQEKEKAVHEAKKAEKSSAKAKAQSNLDRLNKLLEGYNENDAYYQKQKAKAEKNFADWSAQQDAIAGNTGSTGNGVIDNGNVNHNFKVSSKGFISPIQDKSVYYSATYAQHSARGTASVDLCAPARRYVYGNYYHTTNGAKLYAIASGTIKEASFHSISGNYISIDHGNGISSLYAHLKTIYVSVGQKVTQGQVIGLVGNTGSAVYPRPTSSNPVAGSHLHLEMRLNGTRVNPEKYLPSPLVY